MGIRAKILSIAAVMLIIGILAEALTCGYIFTREYSRALQTGALAMGESLLSQLNRIFSLGIPLHELVGFEKQCQELVQRNQELAYVMVVDLNGRILFCNDPSRHGEKVNAPGPEGEAGDQADSRFALQFEGAYEVSIPIRSVHGDKVGDIRIGISAKAIDDKIDHLVKYSAIVSLTALLFLVFILLFALRLWVTRPLSELFKAIHHLRRTREGFYGKLALNFSDEIGQVGLAFDRLIDDLNASHKTILRHAEQLESTVEKRTQDLQRLNDQLMRDIDARKKVENALRESEERYRLLVAGMNDGFFVTDGCGVLTFANNSLAGIHGLDAPDAILGKPIQELVVPSFRETFDQFFSQAVSGGQIPGSIEIPILRRDGQVLHTELKATVDFQKDGTVHFKGVLRDITGRRQAEADRRRWEDRLQQVEKAESLGRMAGAIAHHFNNLLAVVMGNLELALDDPPGGSEIRDHIAESMIASRRAAEISRLMLTYLGQGSGTREPIDLSEACREALPALMAAVPKTMSLKSRFPDSGPIILADAVLVRQVLTNLILNAVEAIGEGSGEIAIETRLMSAGQIAGARIFPADWEPKADTYACVEVSDTGCGMEDGILERIFDPFFSTKFTGRGLGLAVVIGVVKAHEGALAVESAVGRGSTFRVLLPLTKEQPRLPRQTGMEDSQPPAERGLVLLVDDEPMLRKVAQFMLNRLGYEVITAADGVDAIEVFKENLKQIHCVLLDLTIPRMNGWEALAAMRALRPDLPVILSSGYDEAQVMQTVQPERPQAFLHKPYRLADLKAALKMMRKGAVSDSPDKGAFQQPSVID